MFFGGLGGAAAVVPLDAAVIAQGVVIVSGRSEIVASQAGGRVIEALVKEGDEVRSGQLLIRLDAGERTGEIAAMRVRKAELEAHRAQLTANDLGLKAIETPKEWGAVVGNGNADALGRRQAELEAKQSSLRSDLDILEQRAAQIDAQLAGLAAQRLSVVEQVRMVDMEIEIVRGLVEKGLATAPRLRQEERSRAQLSERISGIDADAAALKEKQIETRLQKSRLLTEASVHDRSELAEVDRLLSELTPQLAAAEDAVSALDIKASTDGRVMSISTRNIGDVVAPGEAVVEITPASRQLVVEARIDPQDADDLVPGMASEVRLTGVGGRTAISHSGEIISISPDRNFDERTRESWFTIQVSVPAFEQGSDAVDQAVRPGLPVDVMIVLRKRTALDYLVEPLNQVLWRSMREQ